MPQYEPFDYHDIEAYFNQLYVDSEIAPQYVCGYGEGASKAKETAEQEKATLPEQEWSLVTLLTDWKKMFNDCPQLKDSSTFSNDYHVLSMHDDYKMSYSKVIEYSRSADYIFQGNDVYAGPHNGLVNLYSQLCGIKEEKWAEMPQFAHYAKLLLRKANLPLPIPRTDLPSRCAAEKAYIDQIDVAKTPQENERAMLGILALNQEYQGSDEAIIPYEIGGDYESKKEKMVELYTVYANPILTASNVYQLSRNKELMAFLNTSEAVNAAKEGRLPELAKERILDRQAVEKAEQQREEAERRRVDQENQREEAAKQRAADEKAARGRAVQQKRAEDLLKMLERLGVTGDDLQKKPDELKVPGSKAYNNMTRAALRAYQSAIGSEPYDIDLDQTVRDACRAYTKGKKSVRTFEYGRKRFEACLDLMMSVSAPDESGTYPDDVEAEFARINQVRKAKRGDANYVDPRYYVTDPKKQVTVEYVLENLHDYKLKEFVSVKKQAEYDYVHAKLKKVFPQDAYGEPDHRALVDKDTLNNAFGQRDKDANRFKELCQEYLDKLTRETRENKERQEAERQRQMDEERAMKAAKLKALEEEEFEKLKPMVEKTINDVAEKVKQAEEQERKLLQEEERLRTEAAEKNRKIEDMQRAIRAAKKGRESFEYLLDGLTAEKRLKAFEPQQKEIDKAWVEYRKDIEDEGDFRVVEEYLSELPRPDNGCQYAAWAQLSLLDDEFSKLLKTDRQAAGQNAAAAFCCRMRYKPNEQISHEEMLDVWHVAKQMDGEVFLRGVKKSESRFLRNKTTMQAMRDEYNRVVREPYRKPGEEEIKVSVTVKEVSDLLKEASRNALGRFVEDQSEFPASEMQRREDCEKAGEPFVKDAIPEELYDARDMAIRTAIAGHLVEGLFGTSPIAEVDLNKLKKETEAIVKDGDFMAQVANRDIDKSLMDEIAMSCKLHIEKQAPKADVQRETIRENSAPKL